MVEKETYLKGAGVYYVLLLGVVTLSFAGVFVAMSDAPAITIAFYRMSLSVILLTPIFFRRNDCRLEKLLNFRQTVVGFFLAIHFILWVTAFDYTAVANAVIFIALQPIFTLLLEFIWAREDLQPDIIAGVFITILGSLVVGAGEIGNLFANIKGDFLAVMAAFFAAIYLFSGRSLRKKMNYFPYIFSVYFYASIFLFLGLFIFGHSFTGYGSRNWLLFFGLALGPTVIGHSILNLSVRYVPTTIVSVAVIGEPVLTTLFAWLLLGESIPQLTFPGGLLILLGVVFTMTRKSG
ncbi:DMT family transporter [Halarsenatibacter silvermanii]|uniref:Permease of the drug/metabolite transporter (DMT) superfamily n=1 Tax=Halarsenatibacter silvermanii TaxID=321763 RepID=A0A1G9P972_9FIRM|nr:DMT family transporter [Halarsenatibacter silvermanii]SDL95346.1 Permease of the drug/metabolite transporter (DMT) superfamily [Halarsenatibacter silvermanii]